MAMALADRHVPLGLAAGMLGGPVDYLVMRLVEVIDGGAGADAGAAAHLGLSAAGMQQRHPRASGIVAWLDACRLLRAQLCSRCASATSSSPRARLGVSAPPASPRATCCPTPWRR
jgi:hypothetical protein